MAAMRAAAIGRGLGTTGLALLLTVPLGYLTAVALTLFLNGGDFWSAALSEGPYVLAVGASAGFALFAVFLLVSNLARPWRSNGASFWINVAVLIIAILVGGIGSAAVLLIVATTGSAAAFFGVFTAVLGGACLFVGGVLALVVTHFAVFRRRPPIIEVVAEATNEI